MSKNVNLDDGAVALLDAHRNKGESYSKVIKRKLLPPIHTFGDLETALHNGELDEALGGMDLDLLRKIRSEKKQAVAWLNAQLQKEQKEQKERKKNGKSKC